MKGKIAWIVTDKEFPNNTIKDIYFEEPEDYILDNLYQYHVIQIVYFEVE